MRTTSIPICLLIAAFALVHAARAETLYRETFSPPGGRAAGYAAVGWHANIGSTTSGGILLGDRNRNATLFNFELQPAAGKPDDLPSVNAGPETKARPGYASRKPLSSPANRGVVWTEETTIDRTAWQIEAIRFYSNQSGLKPSGELRIVLRVDSLGTPHDATDDVWVVSAETFSSQMGTASNFAAAGVEHVLKLSEARWHSLLFLPLYSDGNSGPATLPSRLGKPGMEVSLPDGNITAIGLYVPPSDAVIRFDTVEVEGEIGRSGF